MNLRELAVVACVGCGRTSNETPLFPLPAAMAPNLKACGRCLLKFGALALANESDSLIAGATPRGVSANTRCLHCGGPSAGKAWCDECQRELQALRT